MSYIETLKNGKIPKKKSKNKQLTPYDKFMAKKNPSVASTSSNLSPIKARNIDDCYSIVLSLQANHGVILDVSHLDKVQAQRILDFMSGAICAMQGKVDIVGNQVYLFTINGINIINTLDNS